ncbi:MAG: hypothetical protein EP347_05495 [Alphaproteobacteria bacterium]|nr:MAG: hypothetical protein EP347_05495 [Alphaproteobacteria bacterium]
MKPIKNKRLFLSALMATVALTAWTPSSYAGDENSLADNIILDVRLRGEWVEQDGKPDDAEALTLRTRFGFQTDEINGFQLLVEGENVTHIMDDFDDTINGMTNYPVVADPETTELNRLQVSYTGLDKTKIVVGRQRIILGDARYVGNVGFRQNEQTFDAALLAFNPDDHVSFTYAYVAKVRRVFGDDSAVGEFDMDTHIVELAWKGAPGTLTGFAYLADVEDAAAASNATYGVNWSGKLQDTGDLSVKYKFEYARQTDYGNSLDDFELSMMRGEFILSNGTLSGGLGVEVLEGDGARGFATPLATLHRFQGWADVFLTTPADGIRDLYVTAGWNVGQVTAIKGLNFGLVYHNYEADTGGANLGSEWGAVATAKLTDRTALQLKYADYDGAGGYASRTKTWLALTWSY